MWALTTLPVAMSITSQKSEYCVPFLLRCRYFVPSAFSTCSGRRGRPRRRRWRRAVRSSRRPGRRSSYQASSTARSYRSRTCRWRAAGGSPCRRQGRAGTLACSRCLRRHPLPWCPRCRRCRWCLRCRRYPRCRRCPWCPRCRRCPRRRRSPVSYLLLRRRQRHRDCACSGRTGAGGCHRREQRDNSGERTKRLAAPPAGLARQTAVSATCCPDFAVRRVHSSILSRW